MEEMEGPPELELDRPVLNAQPLSEVAKLKQELQKRNKVIIGIHQHVDKMNEACEAQQQRIDELEVAMQAQQGKFAQQLHAAQDAAQATALALEAQAARAQALELQLLQQKAEVQRLTQRNQELTAAAGTASGPRAGVGTQLLPLSVASNLAAKERELEKAQAEIRKLRQELARVEGEQRSRGPVSSLQRLGSGGVPGSQQDGVDEQGTLQLQTRARELEEQLRLQGQQLQTAQTQAEKQQRAAAASFKELATVRKQLQEARASLAALQVRPAASEGPTAAAGTTSAAVLARLERDLASSRQEAARSKQDAQAARTALEQAQERAKAELAQLQEQLDRVHAESAEQRVQYDEIIAKHRQRASRYKQQVHRLQAAAQVGGSTAGGQDPLVAQLIGVVGSNVHGLTCALEQMQQSGAANVLGCFVSSLSMGVQALAQKLDCAHALLPAAPPSHGAPAPGLQSSQPFTSPHTGLSLPHVPHPVARTGGHRLDRAPSGSQRHGSPDTAAHGARGSNQVSVADPLMPPARHRHVSPYDSTPDASGLSACTSDSDRELGLQDGLPSSLPSEGVGAWAALQTQHAGRQVARSSPDTELQGRGSCNDVARRGAVGLRGGARRDAGSELPPIASSGGSGLGPTGEGQRPTPTPSPPLLDAALPGGAGGRPDGGSFVRGAPPPAPTTTESQRHTAGEGASAPSEPAPKRRRTVQLLKPVPLTAEAAGFAAAAGSALAAVRNGKQRGRPPRPRSGSELLQPILFTATKRGCMFARHATSVVRLTAKAAAKALLNGSCTPLGLANGLVAAVVSCAAPVLELAPDDATTTMAPPSKVKGNKSKAVAASTAQAAGTVPPGEGDPGAAGSTEGCSSMAVAVGPHGWGGWCTADAWERSLPLLLGQFVAALDLELHAQGPAGITNGGDGPAARQHGATAIAPQGCGAVRAFLLSNFRARILPPAPQPAPAAAPVRSTGDGGGQVVAGERRVYLTDLDRELAGLLGEGAVPGNDSTPQEMAGLEVTERCALAYVYAVIAKATSDPQELRVLLAQLAGACPHAGKVTPTHPADDPTAVPVLYAAASVWPAVFLAPPAAEETTELSPPVAGVLAPHPHAVWDTEGAVLRAAVVAAGLRVPSVLQPPRTPQAPGAQLTPSLGSSQLSGRSSVLSGDPVPRELLPHLARGLLHILASLPALPGEPQGSGTWGTDSATALVDTWVRGAGPVEARVWLPAVQYTLAVLCRAMDLHQPAGGAGRVGTDVGAAGDVYVHALCALQLAAGQLPFPVVLHVIVRSLLAQLSNRSAVPECRVLIMRAVAEVCQTQLERAGIERQLPAEAVRTCGEVCTALAGQLPLVDGAAAGEAEAAYTLHVAAALACCAGRLQLGCDEGTLRPVLGPCLRTLKSWITQQPGARLQQLPSGVAARFSSLLHDLRPAGARHHT